jgi:hypothetical protein
LKDEMIGQPEFGDLGLEDVEYETMIKGWQLRGVCMGLERLTFGGMEL